MPHVGDLLAELLVRYGVTDIFGQPGGQTAALYDGLARRPDRVRHTLVRDERSAAYAADAFARLTGRPGVCDVTVGPGTTKLTDGLVESFNASVPVIALVGDLPRDWAPYRERGVASQGFGQVALLSAITKSTLEVPSPAALPQMVRAAFRIATSGRPGPVALVVPHDVLDAEWDPDDAALLVDDRYRPAPAYRPGPETSSLADAAALPSGARRPATATTRLEADPTERGRTYGPTVALQATAPTPLAALADFLERDIAPPVGDWPAEAAKVIERARRERISEETSDAVPIRPQRVMRELARHLRPGDVLVADASFSAGWVATHIPAMRAGRDFLFARGQGGLGYAVPAAIGAAMARPGDRIITVSGDGAFSYAIGELATHAQIGSKSVHIVLNNGTLAWLAMWEQFFFDGLRQSVDLESQQTRPSFASAARALGCEGITVESPGGLGAAFAMAFTADRPTVVDVRVDPASTPIHSYRRRLAEGGSHPRPGSTYELPPWRMSPEKIAAVEP